MWHIVQTASILAVDNRRTLLPVESKLLIYYYVRYNRGKDVKDRCILEYMVSNQVDIEQLVSVWAMKQRFPFMQREGLIIDLVRTPDGLKSVWASHNRL